MKEIWRIFKREYTGKNGIIYPDIEISNFGNVKGRNICDNGHGYSCIWYKKKSYLLHTIMAELFPEYIPNPNPDLYKEIDHIDTDKTNNHYTNLRWTDRIGNNRNPLTYKHVLETRKHGNEHPRAHKVKDNISGVIFGCIKEYAKYLHKNPKTVQHWLSGTRKFPMGISAQYI